MTDPRGFRYALQPVLLLRRWDCEQRERDLSELYAELRRHVDALAALQAQLAQACREWEVLGQTPQASETVWRYQRFLAMLQARVNGQRTHVHELECRRDALIDQLQAAQRALEAVEQHHSQTRMEFVRERMNQDYKEADEMWNATAALQVSK